MVDRASRCPRFWNAPWIRVYPHVGISRAIRAVNRPFCSTTPGRPTHRRNGAIDAFGVDPVLVVDSKSMRLIP
jgi:hypothetical protein